MDETSKDVFGNSANEHNALWWIMHGLFNHGWHPHRIVSRCRDCGWGYPVADRGEGAPTKGDKRWLCRKCGADVSRLITWVGRPGTILSSDEPALVWEWLPEDKLPPDLRKGRTEFEIAVEKAVKEQVEKEVLARLDAEFEARVKAAVEVELSTLRTRGKR